MNTTRACIIVVAACVILTSGCSSENKGKIEGTQWRSRSMFVAGKYLPPGLIEMVFAADGKLTYSTPLGVYTGTYSVGFGQTVTLNLDQPLNGRNTHAEKVTITADTMTMADSDGTAVDFDRVP